jgi:hypothetical protein
MPRETKPRVYGALRHIEPAPRLGTWPDALAHLQRELARLGLTERSLKGYQSTILSELEAGAPEENFAQLHEWWHYNIKRLIERGQGRGAPAKPRIDVSVLITTKGNLTVSWWPTGAINDEAGPESDWARWRLIKRIGTRPDNELLFVRDLQYAHSCFAADTRRARTSILPERFQTPELTWRLKLEEREYRRDYRSIDGILLTAGG